MVLTPSLSYSLPSTPCRPLSIPFQVPPFILLLLSFPKSRTIPRLPPKPLHPTITRRLTRHPDFFKWQAVRSSNRSITITICNTVFSSVIFIIATVIYAVICVRKWSALRAPPPALPNY